MIIIDPPLKDETPNDPEMLRLILEGLEAAPAQTDEPPEPSEAGAADSGPSPKMSCPQVIENWLGSDVVVQAFVIERHSLIAVVKGLVSER